MSCCDQYHPVPCPCSLEEQEEEKDCDCEKPCLLCALHQDLPELD